MKSIIFDFFSFEFTLKSVINICNFNFIIYFCYELLLLIFIIYSFYFYFIYSNLLYFFSGLQYTSKEKKPVVLGSVLDEDTALKVRLALQTVDISSLAHISEVKEKRTFDTEFSSFSH